MKKGKNSSSLKVGRNMIESECFVLGCRARSRLGRSLNRLVVDQLFSSCKRTGEKQKVRCLPNAETKQLQNTNTDQKHNKKEDTQKSR